MLLDLILFVFLCQVKSLVFDQSGTYLAVGGSDIRVYICKQWSEVLNFTGEGGGGNALFKMLFQCACHMVLALRKQPIFDLAFFLSNCRPHRTGDWSGLWRERSVPDLCRNGQKSQILQFVEKDKFRVKGEGRLRGG